MLKCLAIPILTSTIISCPSVRCRMHKLSAQSLLRAASASLYSNGGSSPLSNNFHDVRHKAKASLLGARTILGAKGIATRSKKPLITSNNKDAIRLEAIAIWLEAIALRLEAIALGLEAIATVAIRHSP